VRRRSEGPGVGYASSLSAVTIQRGGEPSTCPLTVTAVPGATPETDMLGTTQHSRDPSSKRRSLGFQVVTRSLMANRRGSRSGREKTVLMNMAHRSARRVPWIVVCAARTKAL
jgi:hypothetical protein